MKLILFLAGAILSIWVSVSVYRPVQEFVVGVEKVYIQSKVVKKEYMQKTDTAISSISESYKEIARVFGIEVAEKAAKEEILPAKKWEIDPIEKLFTYDIAFWLSFAAGSMTMSLYLNVLAIIAFFLKPITFFMK